MKKVIISAFTFCLLSTAAVFAQDAGQTSPATQDHEQAADVQEMRTEVAPEALPESISNTLQQEFDEWTPVASYIVSSEEEGQVYEVELQKDDEMKTVKFDEQGNKLEKDKNRDEELD